MAVSVVERNLGRRVSATDEERGYVIRGAATGEEARVALLNSVPQSIGIKTLVSSECEVEEVAEGRDWYGLAKWKSFNTVKQEPNSFHIAFDISGVQTRITQSRGTRKYPENARDFHGAIGVNSDGSIEGCDILVPSMSYNVNYTFSEAYVSQYYVNTLYQTIGGTNLDAFHGFPPGSLLFTKVSGQKRDDGNWDLGYSFGVSENRDGFSVGSISGIRKDGWEYLWVYYVDYPQTTSDGTKYVLKRPVNAYVEQVYKKVAFAGLGIG